MAQSQPFPSSNPRPIDPDHHLWRNGHRWWIAFTVHLPGWQKERIRFSLGTADLAEARARRDEVLREYPSARGCALSLRLDGRRGSERCGASRGNHSSGGSGGCGAPPSLKSERGIHSRASEGHAA